MKKTSFFIHMNYPNKELTEIFLLDIAKIRSKRIFVIERSCLFKLSF